jgi:hypothetical protein
VSIENWVYNRKIAIDISVISETKQEGIKEEGRREKGEIFVEMQS